MWRCSVRRFGGTGRLLPALLLAAMAAGCGSAGPAARPTRPAGRAVRRLETAGGTAGGAIAATDSATGDTVAARRAILRTVSEYVRASNAGDVAALVRLYTDDAVVLPPAQPPVEGRRRIAAFWRHGLESGLTLTPVRLHVHGDVAYVVGRYTLPATEEEPADTGKTVFCLRRLPDGSWRLAADMWSTDAGDDTSDDSSDAADDDERTFTPIT